MNIPNSPLTATGEDLNKSCGKSGVAYACAVSGRLAADSGQNDG